MPVHPVRDVLAFIGTWSGRRSIRMIREGLVDGFIVEIAMHMVHIDKRSQSTDPCSHSENFRFRASTSISSSLSLERQASEMAHHPDAVVT